MPVVEKSCREAGGSTFSELCGTGYLPAWMIYALL